MNLRESAIGPAAIVAVLCAGDTGARALPQQKFCKRLIGCVRMLGTKELQFVARESMKDLPMHAEINVSLLIPERLFAE